jgi:hypothetical protein
MTRIIFEGVAIENFFIVAIDVLRGDSRLHAAEPHSGVASR